jgi:ectoine hydroxylase-related dioxygenase (phytanoyl-CoA dioxygenase family)
MSATITPLVRSATGTALESQIEGVVAALERDGAVALPQLISDEALQEMKEAFESRLTQFLWNDVTGYSRTELKRLGVPDVLTLAQGFVDIGIHPLVMGAMERYIGKGYALAEAKGWQTQKSLKDFHGWHGDAWYDQSAYPKEVMPREVKLAFYLTDVNSGAFQYVRGSHRKETPRLWPKHEGDNIAAQDIMEFKGKAGTAMVFDTSGIHRQGIPVLDPRRAVFYNYHDLDVKLQKEDVEYYRYHPLVLNAAFLGGLSGEQQRVLGFGHKGRFQHDYVRKPQFPTLHKLVTATNAVQINAVTHTRRIIGKVKRMLDQKG